MLDLYVTNAVREPMANKLVPQYVKQNRSLQNTDLVLWCTFGIEHVVRAEDWPVLPAHHAAFQADRVLRLLRLQHFGGFGAARGHDGPHLWRDAAREGC